MPLNIVFRHMVSRTSQNVFCILTTTESVFNSACSVGKFYVVESGIDERRLCAVRVRSCRPKPTGERYVICNNCRKNLKNK